MELVKKTETHIIHTEYKPIHGNGNFGLSITDKVEIYSNVSGGHITISREDARAFAHELLELLDATEPKK